MRARAAMMVVAPLAAVLLLAGCGSPAVSLGLRELDPGAGACHLAGPVSQTLRLSFSSPRPRLVARVGDVIEVRAHWRSTLSAPRAFPKSAVCRFNARHGHAATADFVLTRPGRIFFSTSDAVATPAMDPAFGGTVRVRGS